MPNLTSVHVTSGIPDAGTGTVSTIDELILVGLPLTGGTVTVSGTNLTAVISGTTFISGGNITAVVSGTTFISGGTSTAIASGDAASGGSDIGNPLKIGGLAKTANPTGVTDGQRVNGLFDVLGKMVVVHSIRALKANFFTTLPGTTNEITLLPAISTCFQDIYGCILANTSATSVTAIFKDSTAGNSQFEFNVPAGDTRGFMMPESGAFKQTAQNTTWTITMGTLMTSLVASVLYVKNTTS